MKPLRAGLVWATALLGFMALCLAAAIERTLPAQDASLRLPGLHRAVDVRFDRLGIPRIVAADDFDAAEALGFIHARDRMMQMDLMRRAASGELSELVGQATLRHDEVARILGTRRAAEQSLAGSSARTRALLEAYSRGVNAFIAVRGRFASPEYLLLGAPRAWAPVDSVLWAETMGLALSGNLNLELARLALSGRLSRAAILSLWPTTDAPPADQASVAGTSSLALLARRTLDAMPRFPAPFSLPDLASNAWAVDGRHSVTGAPLLAGDPHLSYGLPCLWYLARIDTPASTLVGATAPGTPFMVIGRNRRLAWSFTTAAADTEDLFVEHALDQGHYAGPAGPLAFTRRIERIKVRGRPDTVLIVRETRHGPVLSDLPGPFGLPSHGSDVIAAQIASLAADNRAPDGLDALDHAADVDEAGRAASMLTAPVQNLMVADRARIGLFTTGRVPIRRSGDGAMASDGASGRDDWIGAASGDALPHIVSPSSGVLVNANEPVVGGGSTVAMGRDSPGDWRSLRIHQMLGEDGRRFGAADFARMQGDVRSALIERLLPVLAVVPAADGLSATALRLLAHWDGTMAAQRPQPLIVSAWLASTTAELARLAGDADGDAIAPLSFAAHVLTGDGAGCGGSCAALLSRTLSQSMAGLAKIYGQDPSRWRWGDAHRAVFANPLWAMVPLLGRVDRIAVGVGGDASTVDAQAFVDRTPPFEAVHGASYRGVYDLADPDRSRFVIATGQSGNPVQPPSARFLAAVGLRRHGRDRSGCGTEQRAPCVAARRLTARAQRRSMVHANSSMPHCGSPPARQLLRCAGHTGASGSRFRLARDVGRRHPRGQHRA